ncbi:MAG: thiamine biosynthesis protein ThiS [Epulopiscium sp. Nuni2H_MBin001]|nr:MAG: thiamine biosynthesis protein ThiS [Epulopiscium sp. Nuni2H_MBin001]
MLIYNGQEIMLSEQITLEQFLVTKNYDILKIAIELNSQIIPKTQYGQVVLNNTDKLEVVSFVGGG